MWANAQRDGRPAKYRWHPVLKATKFGSRPLLDCRANRRAQDLEDAVNFAPGKIPLHGKSRIPAQCAKFGWLPLSDVAAVMKPRSKSR